MRLSAEEKTIQRFISQNLDDLGRCSINLFEMRRIVEESRKYKTISDLLKKVSPKNCRFELDKNAKVVNIYLVKE